MFFERFKKHEKVDAPQEAQDAPAPTESVAASEGYTFAFTPTNLFWTLTCDYIECRSLGSDDGPRVNSNENQKVRVTVRLPQKPDGLGLEMREGAWVRTPDGTLRFFGGTWLYSGAFGSDKNKVKRIVIDGFNCIIGPLFEGFPQLEEVVFSNPAVHVDHRAFAGCHKLKTVRFRDEAPRFEDWAEDDAFYDTPYAAALKGEEFLSVAERNAVLAKSEWGRVFLDGLHEAVDHFEFDPDKRAIFSEYECDPALIPCKRALCEGYLAGDPDMMYFAAQCEYWSQSFYTPEFDLVNFRDILKSFGHEAVEPAEMYLAAAEAGSVRAMLYVAWLMEPNSEGDAFDLPPENELYDRDAEKSALYLERARAASGPLETLEITDLDFLADDVDRLYEAAADADCMEDIALYGTPGVTYPVPDPSWRELYERGDYLAQIACEMGSTICVDTAMDGHYSGDAIYGTVRLEKERWSEWCREKGMLL